MSVDTKCTESLGRLLSCVREDNNSSASLSAAFGKSTRALPWNHLVLHLRRIPWTSCPLDLERVDRLSAEEDQQESLRILLGFPWRIQISTRLYEVIPEEPQSIQNCRSTCSFPMGGRIFFPTWDLREVLDPELRQASSPGGEKEAKKDDKLVSSLGLILWKRPSLRFRLRKASLESSLTRVN